MGFADLTAAACACRTGFAPAVVTVLGGLLVSGMEEGERAHQLIGLAGQFLGGGGHFLRCRGILLDHLLQLLQGLVDLLGAGILLLAGSRDLLHQFGGALDIGHQLIQHLA